MAWLCDNSETGFTKTNNCSTKMSFMIELDFIHDKILIDYQHSCNPEIKQNSFYYNIKTGVHRK